MKSKKTEIVSGKQPHRSHGSFRGVQIEYVVGKTSEQPDVQAVVCAVNPLSPPDTGPAQNLRPGEAVLDADHIPSASRLIYFRGPVYGVDEPASELLANCYRNALRLADAHGFESVAFPAISAGAAGYPFIEATEIACRAILEIVPSLTRIKRVRFVFTSARSANIACTLFSQHIQLRA